MNDIFKEQLVKKEPDTRDMIKRIGVVIICIVIGAASFFIPVVQSFSFFVIATLGVGAYFIFTNLNLEYEYIFTNGELDIDVIYNRARRKHLLTAHLKDFEVMAHVDDKEHERDFAAATETKVYASGVTKPNTYAFLTTCNGKKIKIIIEPNDVMLQAFSTVLTPRKLFKKV